MSQFMFFAGTGRGRVSDSLGMRADKIAAKHECSFTWQNEPGQGWIHWFSGPNLGHPFDSALADAVRSDLKEAGIVLP